MHRGESGMKSTNFRPDPGGQIGLVSYSGAGQAADKPIAHKRRSMAIKTQIESTT